MGAAAPVFSRPTGFPSKLGVPLTVQRETRQFGSKQWRVVQRIVEQRLEPQIVARNSFSSDQTSSPELGNASAIRRVVPRVR